MKLPALLALASVVPAQALAGDNPVVVTGHAWAPFISPMGEPFRARSVSDNTLSNWLSGADRNRDGRLTLDEMRADADRFFATLDTDGDGMIGPDELMHYEYEVAPDIQVNSRTRQSPGAPQQSRDGRKKQDRRDDPMDGRLQGAARYALLNLPQPVAAADADFDRAITREEFRIAAATRFQILDHGRTGSLTLTQLQAMVPDPDQKGRPRKSGRDKADQRIGNPLPSGS